MPSKTAGRMLIRSCGRPTTTPLPADHPVLLAMRMRPELERVRRRSRSTLLKRYVAAAADDWEALRALARAELALGNHAEAARHFQECLKGRPDDVRAWRDYLTMLLEQGDLDAFLALLEKPPKSAETEPETWMFRGVASEKAGDWQAAADHFRKAIELNPYVPKYYYRLAMVEERLGLRDAGPRPPQADERDERGACPVTGRLCAITSPRRSRTIPAHRTWRPHASTSPRSAKHWAGPALADRPGTELAISP